MSRSSVQAAAPLRLDLAGGTLDIPPLDLLVEGASTLNVAIDRMASATLTAIDSGWELCAADQQREVRLESLEEAAADEALPLLSRLLAHFAPGPGVRLETSVASPAGAGLGGSSALAVAVTAGLTAWLGEELEADALLGVARDVETRVLGVPTGYQDHVAALCGGACSLRFGVGGMSVDSLEVDLDALRRRAVLVYSGRPRASGINNWQVTRAFVDGDGQVRRRLTAIARAAERARDALVEGDLDEVAAAVADEWAQRRELAPGISTPAIDELLSAARAAGALAGKVCGAGGGGCVLLLTAEGAREAVEAAARGQGMQVLEFGFAVQGLSVQP